jgi:hypothetical protein
MADVPSFRLRSDFQGYRVHLFRCDYVVLRFTINQMSSFRNSTFVAAGWLLGRIVGGVRQSARGRHSWHGPLENLSSFLSA